MTKTREKGWFYLLLAMYEGFDKEKSFEDNPDEAATDYYTKLPYPKTKIFFKIEINEEEEDGLLMRKILIERNDDYEIVMKYRYFNAVFQVIQY